MSFDSVPYVPTDISNKESVQGNSGSIDHTGAPNLFNDLLKIVKSNIQNNSQLKRKSKTLLVLSGTLTQQQTFIDSIIHQIQDSQLTGTEAQDSNSLVRSVNQASDQQHSKPKDKNSATQNGSFQVIEHANNNKSSVLGYKFLHSEEIDLNIYNFPDPFKKVYYKLIKQFETIDHSDLLIINLMDFANYLDLNQFTENLLPWLTLIPPRINDKGTTTEMDTKKQCDLPLYAKTDFVVIVDSYKFDTIGSTKLEFQQQFLRLIGLKHSSSVVYTTLNDGSGQHRNSKKSINLSSIKDLIFNRLGLQQDVTLNPELTDSSSILIPNGWDSWGKIRTLDDSFDCEGYSEFWTDEFNKKIESPIGDEIIVAKPEKTNMEATETQDPFQTVNDKFQRLLGVLYNGQ
ncbi:hypothetical protein BVG19_g3167 [[Candida] boidinii]|nr:hypothetical protein BVG19_g3167 [[Candida] boidinii]OWB52450.1 hypothetical protein B5S27_g4025 [[Candida] boidinii]